MQPRRIRMERRPPRAAPRALTAPYTRTYMYCLQPGAHTQHQSAVSLDQQRGTRREDFLCPRAPALLPLTCTKLNPRTGYYIFCNPYMYIYKHKGLSNKPPMLMLSTTTTTTAPMIKKRNIYPFRVWSTLFPVKTHFSTADNPITRVYLHCCCF